MVLVAGSVTGDSLVFFAPGSELAGVYG